jgi:hypothetical protein
MGPQSVWTLFPDCESNADFLCQPVAYHYTHRPTAVGGGDDDDDDDNNNNHDADSRSNVFLRG